MAAFDLSNTILFFIKRFIIIDLIINTVDFIVISNTFVVFIDISISLVMNLLRGKIDPTINDITTQPIEDSIRQVSTKPNQENLGGAGGSVLGVVVVHIIDRDRCGHGLWAKVIQTVTGRQGSRPPIQTLLL